MASLLSLMAQTSAEAQSFQARRLGGGQQSAGRVRSELSLEFTLHSRDHFIHERPDARGRVIVREAAQGPRSEGSTFVPRAGLPDLGARTVRVLLPYEAADTGMRMEVIEEQTESLGFFSVAPAGVPETGVLQEDGSVSVYFATPEGVQLDEEGRDPVAYSSDVALPARSLLLTGVGNHRAYRYARVTFFPFRWNPMTKELYKVIHAKAKLSCMRRGYITSETRDRELGDPGLESDGSGEGYMLPSGVFESYEHPRRSAEGDYLIVTTDLIKSTSAKLGPFIDMKRAQGFTVIVKTMEEILSMGPSIGRAESLRTYLRSEYQELGVEHLLLIGDPDPDDQGLPSDTVGDVPMFMTWPQGEVVVGEESSEDDHRRSIAPTDLYYTELSRGDWDLDGDGFPGEFLEDRRSFSLPGFSAEEYGYYKNGYAIDFDEELTGARIPFGDVERVDAHLEAQIEHQSVVPDDFEMSIRERVMLAMGEFYLSTNLNILGLMIGNEARAHVNGPFTTTEIYEVPGGDLPMGEDALSDAWSGEFGEGLVVFSGHGSDLRTVTRDGIPFIHADDVPSLNTTFTRSIVISIACLNARPSTTDNLTHELLEHAAVGMYAHTGSGFYLQNRYDLFGELSYMADLGYLISQELMAGSSIGASLRETRATRSTPDAQSAQNLLVITAYGDPSGGYLSQ